MNKEKLEQYAKLKQDEKILTEKIKQLSAEILSDMVIAEADEVEIDSGKFIISTRRTWKYSQTIEKQENELKEMKKEEEAKGFAEYEEKSYLIFRSNI